MSFKTAKESSKSIGENWRLPTLYELSEMYLNKNKIGGFQKVTIGVFLNMQKTEMIMEKFGFLIFLMVIN